MQFCVSVSLSDVTKVIVL